MKIHLNDDQLDGHLYAWCGRGSTVVTEAVFEATPTSERCQICERNWFPNGQPDWHFAAAVKAFSQQ